MHMVEEVEHKAVAHDVYVDCAGNYIARACGLLHRATQVPGFGLLVLFTALKKGDEPFSVRRPAEIASELGTLLCHLAPTLLRA